MSFSQIALCAWLSFVHFVQADSSKPIVGYRANASDILPDVGIERIGHVTPDSSWSVAPWCSRSTPKSEEYCVYTSTNFANGRGISIVTSPAEATELLKLPAFSNPNIHSALGVNEFTNPPFAATQIKGRGIGLIANRTIKRGEWLMSFTPAFMMTKEAVDEMSQKERLHLQQLAFDQLPSPVRNTALALYGQTDGTADDFIDDVLDTNTFSLPLEMSLGDDNEIHEVDYKCLFPEIARFNHACRPTADYFFDTTTLVLHIMAFRDVFPGEELTITYIDPLQKHRARQKALHRSWGFTCDCSACSASPELVKASDARVDTIIELQEELADRTTESEGSPVLAEKVISLLEQEHLWTLMHDGYSAAAIEYSGVGDAAKAQAYAQLALQSGLICRGAGFVDDWHRDMLTLKNDPQSHPSWNFRVSQQEGS